MGVGGCLQTLSTHISPKPSATTPGPTSIPISPQLELLLSDPKYAPKLQLPSSTNSHPPPRLRHWGSLETIQPINTTASDNDNSEPPRSSYESTHLAPSPTNSSHTPPESSNPVSTSTASWPTSTSSCTQRRNPLLRLFKAPHKEPLLQSSHLEISRHVSLDQFSEHTCSTSDLTTPGPTAGPSTRRQMVVRGAAAAAAGSGGPASTTSAG